MKNASTRQLRYQQILLGTAILASAVTSATAATITPSGDAAGAYYVNLSGPPATQNSTHEDQSAFSADDTTANVLLGSLVLPVTNTTNAIGSLSGLTDGQLGGFNVSSNGYANISNHPYSFLIVLGTATNLSELQSIAAWEGDRINQNYTVSYTTASTAGLAAIPTPDLTVFLSSFTPATEIGSASYNPSNGLGVNGTGSSTEVTFGDGSSSITGGNAATALLFQFTGEGVVAPTLREIQAYAVTPEPSTYALLFGGMVVLVGLRVRRNASLR